MVENPKRQPCLTWDAWAPTPPEVVVGSMVHKYQLTFTWTEQHLTAAQLEPMRHVGDKERGLEEVPDWVDWSMVSRGQRFFQRYFYHAINVLFFESLVGGFSAVELAKVLESTGKFRQSAIMRLLGTTSWVCLVCTGDLRPGSKAYKAIVDVRRAHSRVRDQYSGSVNQEDMCATLLAFSDVVLAGIERDTGLQLHHDDKTAYLHLWRWIGYVIGVDERFNPCTSPSTARAVLESIFVHIVHPGDASKSLVHHVLGTLPGGERGYRFRSEAFRHYNGDELADELGIMAFPKKPSWRLWFMVNSLRIYGAVLESKMFDLLLVSLHLVVMRLFIFAASHRRRPTKRRSTAAAAAAKGSCPF